jgi:hypothetical protein
MLEHKPSVNDIEPSHLAPPQWKSTRVTAAPLHQILLAGRFCLTARLGQLLLIALDSDHPPIRQHCPGHRPRQLAQPASHIQNRFIALESKFSQAGSIQQLVQQRESFLLLRFGTMNLMVSRCGSHGVP